MVHFIMSFPTDFFFHMKNFIRFQCTQMQRESWFCSDNFFFSTGTRLNLKVCKRCMVKLQNDRILVDFSFVWMNQWHRWNLNLSLIGRKNRVNLNREHFYTCEKIIQWKPIFAIESTKKKTRSHAIKKALFNCL